RHRLAVPRQHRLEGLDVGELRLRFDDSRNALQAVHHLRVHRMLDPERAVLIEGGDALRRRHELRAPFGRRRLYELDNGLLGRAVVPGRQRVLRSGDSDQQCHCRQCCAEECGLSIRSHAGSFKVASVPTTSFDRISSRRRGGNARESAPKTAATETAAETAETATTKTVAAESAAAEPAAATTTEAATEEATACVAEAATAET